MESISLSDKCVITTVGCEMNDETQTYIRLGALWDTEYCWRW